MDLSVGQEFVLKAKLGTQNYRMYCTVRAVKPDEQVKRHLGFSIDKHSPRPEWVASGVLRELVCTKSGTILWVPVRKAEPNPDKLWSISTHPPVPVQIVILAPLMENTKKEKK